MSTFSLARGPRGVVGAWEDEGRIRFGALEAGAKSRQASGESDKCRHPSIAVAASGEVLVSWIEDMWWSSAGTLAWRVLDASGAQLAEGRGEPKGLPSWSLAQSVALPGGGFVILW